MRGDGALAADPVDTETRPAMGTGAPGRGRTRTWWPPRRFRAAEFAIATGLGLLVLVVHDVGYLLRQPYWNDESWVAVTTRFPLTDLRATTSSTPIGWSVLLRLFTVSGH